MKFRSNATGLVYEAPEGFVSEQMGKNPDMVPVEDEQKKTTKPATSRRRKAAEKPSE